MVQSFHDRCTRTLVKEQDERAKYFVYSTLKWMALRIDKITKRTRTTQNHRAHGAHDGGVKFQEMRRS